METGKTLILPLVETEIDPKVWATEGQIVRVLSAAPVQVRLKASSALPNQKQYPLRSKAGKGLKLINNNLKQ